jgi:hypothetical protein
MGSVKISTFDGEKGFGYQSKIELDGSVDALALAEELEHIAKTLRRLILDASENGFSEVYKKIGFLKPIQTELSNIVKNSIKDKKIILDMARTFDSVPDYKKVMDYILNNLSHNAYAGRLNEMIGEMKEAERNGRPENIN